MVTPCHHKLCECSNHHVLHCVGLHTAGVTYIAANSYVSMWAGLLRLQVLVAVRGPIVVVAGVLLFAEVVTSLELIGYCIALAGFVWYNIAQVRCLVL